MATFTSRTVTSTRREWVVLAAPPWGATAADIGKAWGVAELAYRETHGLSREAPVPDDALSFHAGDDEIVIAFTTEEN